MSVARAEEVWGAYGVYTAHEHNYLFKIIYKKRLKIPKNDVQILPKSTPRGHLKPKKQADAAKSRKKPILGGRVPHRARQKDPKMDPQTRQRAPKSKNCVQYQNDMRGGVSIGATEVATGG